ncbi:MULTISPECIES: iron chaperone [unclassified Leifsonia]|uniref:iron chaperone n=1 Tax=unclassified Leifsonia TaxID=2663824 RepID=UPI000700C98E|nr:MULTISPECIES: DUF1801 domain-containing protein [unclassified Leifsonia]KQX06996.1 hypothetical protein ASC59_04080 [Leifsonia sp. Root1293]KRA11279.1 hypothetical protein ASD61_04080 [Leifsonia sp. Root60]
MAEASTSAGKNTKSGFTAEERAAMRERAKELKASANREEAIKAVLAAIAEMPDEERAVAERLHAVVTEAAPELDPRLWYGQPAYAKGGAIVCFFQNPSKFKTRYTTLGFNDSANLDDGTMWPTSFAITSLTAESEKAITALVKKAVG